MLNPIIAQTVMPSFNLADFLVYVGAYLAAHPWLIAPLSAALSAPVFYGIARLMTARYRRRMLREIHEEAEALRRSAERNYAQQAEQLRQVSQRMGDR